MEDTSVTRCRLMVKAASLGLPLSNAAASPIPSEPASFRPGRSDDGMMVRALGGLLVCAGLNRLRGTDETLAVRAGVHLFTADGHPAGVVPTPKDPVTNIAEFRAERGVFFVTAGRTLFQMSKAWA